MHTRKRNDLPLSEIVVAGIEVDNARGAAFAWAYMSTRGVPQGIIFRVLSEVRLRRNTDPIALCLDWETTRNELIRVLKGV